MSHAKAKRAIQLLAEPPQQLKGVNENIPYPLICIDRRDGKETSEDKLLKRDIRCSLDNVIDYLGEQFDEDGGPLRRPVIESDPSPAFGQVPDDVRDARDRLLADDLYIAYERDAKQSDPSVAMTSLPPLPSARNKVRLRKRQLKKTHPVRK